jgi:hypothetical protein
MGLVDKVRVDIEPSYDGEVFEVTDKVRDDFRDAGWSDDPGTGVAIHLPDGREVVNPVPVAPPVGYVQEISVMDQIMAKLAAQQRILAEDAIYETEADADDFDVEDEFDPFSMFELQDMQPDAPVLPVNVDVPVEPVVAPPEKKAAAKKPPPVVEESEEGA